MRYVKYVGIDIGSTASKTVVMDQEKKNILYQKIMPTGWNSKETSFQIKNWLDGLALEEYFVTATGYGRVAVPYADKTVTEITCHGKGASFLHPGNMTVIDIGGQDTKVILIENGMVTDFVMNDKCSAGTGKFLEVMANRLGLTLEEILEAGRRGKQIKISSMCTVFAESEIISLMGQGTPKDDIASGVVYSIVSKVVTQISRKGDADNYFLTGGFSESELIKDLLSKELKAPVFSHPEGRFAGAIGAALLGV